MSDYTTYSFKDLSGAFTYSAVAYTFGGQMGMGQIVIHMATEKTSHDTAADGTVQITAVAGDSGTVTIECQQTSSLHKYLLLWANTVKTAMKNNDISTWASASMLLRNTVDGSTHTITGISPQNIPDKTYASAGGKVSWVLMAADIQSIPA